jgi:hypothetical protein
MGVYNASAPAPVAGQSISDQIDSAGSLYSNNEGRKATYRATTAGVVVTANGVIFSLQGSATKVVRVTRVFLIGVLTTAAQVTTQIYRTTGAVSSAAGTAAITPAKLASANATATAAANSYTSSTLGAGSALIATSRAFYAPATAMPTGIEFTFGTRNGQALVLNGTGEFMQVSVAASGYTGALFDIDAEFTEE